MMCWYYMYISAFRAGQSAIMYVYSRSLSFIRQALIYLTPWPQLMTAFGKDIRYARVHMYVGKRSMCAGLCLYKHVHCTYIVTYPPALSIILTVHLYTYQISFEY